MKKAFALVALVAALFVAGNVQAQNMVYVGYTPETFTYSNSSANFQGICAGFTKNINLAQGFGVAAGAQFRLNMRNAEETFIGITGKNKETQALIDVPILFNYGIAINRDLTITPFIGPMLSLGVIGKTQITENLFNTQYDYDWYGDSGVSYRPDNRFNLYGVFGANLRFSQFNLFGGYRLGLLDLKSSDDITLKANGFFIGLGYSF